MRSYWVLPLIFLILIGVHSKQAEAAFFHSEAETGIQDGYCPTKIWWKHWTVSSSEELWDGRIHRQYPLSHLFDDGPNTTWADSSPRKSLESYCIWRSRFGLLLRAQKLVRVDALWIMNGYNKRRDLFLRNDRIIRMEVWVNDRKVKTVQLADRMGWHKIALPPNNIGELGLLFTGIRKGKGPNNDVCISELALLNKGHEINMRMPRAILFEDGNQSGDTLLDCALITAHNGNIITQGLFPPYGMYEDDWSPNERYICGLWYFLGRKPPNRELLWIVDTRAQTVVKRLYLPVLRNDDPDTKDLVWVGSKTVEVRWIGKDRETIAHRKRYNIR